MLLLQHGILNEDVETHRKEILGEGDDKLSENIFKVFQNVVKILNKLKVTKDSKDKVEYLSHTTKLSVFTQLLPVHEHDKKLGAFRMYHIAYANDPTEGTVLFDRLGISPDKREMTDIPYILIASFCGGKDPQALDSLPIWNMYGDEAKGVAMLFNINDIASREQGHVMSGSSYRSSLPKGNEKNKRESVKEEERGKGKTEPLQILYKVHYVNNQEETRDTQENNEKNENIDEIIGKIKKELEIIENLKPLQAKKIYNKILDLLSGLRYLIKDRTYAYENEYRLVCFASEKNISEVLKIEEDAPEERFPRIYVETKILKNLCGVMTAPKVKEEQALRIQYLLHRYKKNEELSKLEESPVYKSRIPYR